MTHDIIAETAIDSFESLDLPDELLRALDDLGFHKPTPIQAKALPSLLDGDDLTGQAQTGTGKTACFLLATLTNLLDIDPIEEVPPGGSRPRRAPQALIIAPTRELAMQIADDAKPLLTYTDLSLVTLCGGLPWKPQATKLDQGVDLVIGTPGRILDMLQEGKLVLRHLDTLVIDEADRIFDMGFIDDLNRIMRYVPKRERRQTMLFSATFSPEVLRLTKRYMYDPVHVQVTPDNVTSDRIEQRLYHVSTREKVELLMGLLQVEQPKRTMIFVNRKVDGEKLAWRLTQNGFEAVYLSGDLPQKKRSQIIEALKNHEISILVATDVASRGIHVDDISHVFNYDIPQDPEDYVHRIGRTARAGLTGKSFSFACEDSVAFLPAVEALLGAPIPVAHPEDSDFMPDRAGRFPRQSQTFTGWPPPSRATAASSEDKGNGAKEGDAQKRRRRKPKPKTEG